MLDFRYGLDVAVFSRPAEEAQEKCDFGINCNRFDVLGEATCLVGGDLVLGDGREVVGAEIALYGAGTTLFGSVGGSVFIEGFDAQDFMIFSKR